MKKIEFGKMSGYPHYLKIKLVKGGGTMIDMVSEHTSKPEVGDTLEKQNESYKVLEIVEERPAKGNHPKTVVWQKLRCD